VLCVTINEPENPALFDSKWTQNIFPVKASLPRPERLLQEKCDPKIWVQIM